MMKKLLVILGAICALGMSANLSRVAADEGNQNQGNIPLSALAGGYASIVQGAIAFCLNSTTHLEESCTTGGALVIPFTAQGAGKITFDKNGNFCVAYIQVQSNLPVDASPPLVFPFNVAGKTIDYDPASGTGDLPFTGYSGGKCNGATFDGTGATVIDTGTVHFVASGNGKRMDGIFTSATDAMSGIGDFSASIFNLRQ
jgi:hypothetical protein